jgi:hypothetical protein
VIETSIEIPIVQLNPGGEENSAPGFFMRQKQKAVHPRLYRG